MRRALLLAALAVAPPAAARAQAAADTTPLLLVPAAVWDGVADAVQPGWVVLLRGDRIVAAGPPIRVEVPAGTERVELPGSTLMPGLIEGHSHLFLHPYDETLWDDQVLKEPAGYRMAAAVAHAEATVRAGVTTTRDLGTEGVADYDVQLKRAIERGVVPGPRAGRGRRSARRSSTPSCAPHGTPGRRWWPTPARRKGCGARCWPA